MTRKILIGIGIVGIVGGVLLFVLIGQAKTVPWGKDYEAALELAKAEQRPVVTYLFTDWCTYCQQMEDTTFKDPLVTEEMAPQYLWVKLNAETDPKGQELREQFGVSSYPTIVLLDSDGYEVDRMEGYYPPAKFKEVIEYNLNSPISFGRLKRFAQENPNSLETQYALGEKYLERNKYLEASKQFAKVIVEDPENKSRTADAAFYFLAYALAAGGERTEALRQIEEMEKQFPESRVLADAYVLKGQILQFAGKNDEARKVFEEYMKRFEGHGYYDWVADTVKELKNEEFSLSASH